MTLELNLTAMFFVAAIWFSRYCDIVADKAAAAHQHRDLAGEFGEIHRGLAR